MDRRAVIDVGTNSVRMLIAELKKDDKDSGINIIDKWVIPTRLGEGVDLKGYLSAKAIERTLDAIKSLIQIASASSVDSIYCFATSAVRDAANREHFIELVDRHCGIDVAVLLGDEEARAAFVGALMDMPYGYGKVLLVDIGGGSTELVQGQGNCIEYSVSLDIGAVRLTEMFPLGYPADYESWKAMAKFIHCVLSRQWRGEVSSLPIVGVGGTITTLAAMAQGMEVYDRNRIQGYRLDIELVDELLHKILACPIEERKKLAGLPPSRADIIPAGICILVEILNFFKVKDITVSDHDNLEGMLILSGEKIIGSL